MSSTARRRLIRLLVLLLITLLLWYLLHVLLPDLLGPLLEAACNSHTRKEENTMENDCPFLERLRQPQIGGIFGCGAGVNFYPVGKDRERCRVCDIATLGRLPDCGYLDVHAFLNVQRGQPLSVEVQPYCTRFGYLSSDLRCYARCPERLPQAASLSRPALAPTPVG